MGQAQDLSARLTAAANDGEYDTLGELYDDDAVVTDPDGETKGREAIVGYFRAWFDAFPDAELRDELTAESGDTVFNRWVFSGTNSGPMQTPEGTIPATGKRVTHRGCDVITVRDGRIQAHEIYFDRLALMDQLGLADAMA